MTPANPHRLRRPELRELFGRGASRETETTNAPRAFESGPSDTPLRAEHPHASMEPQRNRRPRWTRLPEPLMGQVFGELAFREDVEGGEEPRARAAHLSIPPYVRRRATCELTRRWSRA